jgi:hypothetical protein
VRLSGRAMEGLQVLEALFRGDYATAPVSVPDVLLGLLLAFLAGHVIGWVYMITHSGLSYSRSFVNSLVVIPVIVAAVMMVLSNNLVTAFGLMAVFAIVRFRNILRDTLDTSYILSVIVIGMGCGTFKYSTAIIGCGLIATIMLYMWFTSLGSRHRYDFILNVHWRRPLSEASTLQMLLWRHSRKVLLASQRLGETDEGTSFSYRLLLRDPNRVDDLLREVNALEGVQRVSALQAEDESEL